MKSFVLFTELGYPKLQCLKKKYRNDEVKECVASMEREVLIINFSTTHRGILRLLYIFTTQEG
jgi:hypothetical protein